MNCLKYKQHNKIVLNTKLYMCFVPFFLDKLWSAMHLLFKGIASYCSLIRLFVF